jgi:hypothetical protein
VGIKGETEMPIIDTSIRSIQCDGPGCDKHVLFDRKDEKATFENPENIWLRATRVVQTADGRNLVFHSDECEVKSVGTGKHNIPEAPKIVPTGNPAAIAALAQAAANAKAADAAIRAGEPAKVQLTD